MVLSLFARLSTVLAYDIFLKLEVAGGQDLFRPNANLVRYGLIPTSVDWQNPHGLPIGISKATVTTPIKRWPTGDCVGMTCAACHPGQLRYKGKVLPIEGGDNKAIDRQGLLRGFGDALQNNPASPRALGN